MKPFPSLTLSVVVCLFVALANSQSGGHHFPTPPPSLDPDSSNHPDQSSATLLRHIDGDQLQRQADDLARTAQTIPADVTSIRKGVLPKDMIEKLKQIEKLSKRLRSELNP